MACDGMGWARGDDVRLVFTFPAEVDISGFTILFTVKTRPDDVADDSSAVVAAAAAVTGAHTAEVVLSPAESAVPARPYVWDLKMVGPGGEVTHTSAGTLTVRDVVTNRG